MFDLGHGLLFLAAIGVLYLTFHESGHNGKTKEKTRLHSDP